MLANRGGNGFFGGMRLGMAKFIVVSAVLSIVFLVSWRGYGQGERPNIVFIMADDLGWSDLACYGSDLHETPFLDRLAKESVVFSDAYAASPVCSPTRASIMAGKDPARLHMTIWREWAKRRGNRKLLEPVALDALPLEHDTLAEKLRDAGYYTAHIGKWHLGDAVAYPQAHGFDVNIGGTLWGAPEAFFYPYSSEYRRYFDGWRYVPDLEPGREGDYLTDRLTDKAIDIIEQRRDEPFFLNLWYYTVHTPIEGKPDVVEKYRRKIASENPKNHVNPHMAAMVESLDENVGRVLSKIEDLGLKEQTIVVFTSDNGGFIGQCKLNPDLQVTSNVPLRSGKGSCYEGGIRIPLMIRGPKTLPNHQSSELVYTCDLYPTILAMAGLSDRIEQTLDGVDIGPLLVDRNASLERDTLYFHYPHYYRTTTPVSAIREGDWKLLEYFEDGRLELYNLRSDLGETENLARSRPGLANRLQKKLDTWRKSVDAQLPELNHAFKER